MAVFFFLKEKALRTRKPSFGKIVIEAEKVVAEDERGSPRYFQFLRIQLKWVFPIYGIDYWHTMK